jgi:CubicO group peptidase (beta-lactamase class C family)
MRDVDAGRAQIRFDQRVQSGDGRLLVFPVVVDQSVPGSGVGLVPKPGRHRQHRTVGQQLVGQRGRQLLDPRIVRIPGPRIPAALGQLDELGVIERLFEPGTGWSYSNTNYVLARLLIEKVTGRSYAEEMQRLILGPLGLSGTVVPDASPEIPEPHAHAYYRYEDAGEQKTVDVARQNPSWISTGGDMISTLQDLHMFIPALMGGKLLPAPLLAEMCTPHPTGIPDMDYGLGVFVVNTDGGGTVISHNGGMVGHAALMYSTPDGSKTLTAALNCVEDADLSIAAAFQNAQQRLVNAVFCGGQADPAQPTD